MQLLTEEFFRKTFEYINGINIFIIRLAVKFVFYLVLGVLSSYIFISVYRKDFLPIVVIIGFIILGEVAHYFRKTREKVMTSRVTEKNSLNEKPKNERLLESGKSKNKNLIKKEIKPGKIKNKNLLEISKPKNNGLLRKV